MTGPRDKPPGSRRRRALAVLAALPVALALLEVGLRLLPSRARELTLGAEPGSVFHVPGGRYVYLGAPLGKRADESYRGNVVVWNAAGHHDVDHERAKPRGRVRVAVLGDSYVEGVPLRTDELFHRRLEVALVASAAPAGVEALAFARAGWSQRDELEALRAEALPYSPDLVVLELLPSNDVRGNDPELDALANATGATAGRRLEVAALKLGLLGPAWLGERLHLVSTWLGKDPFDDAEVYRARPPAARAPLWDRAWRATEELLLAIDRETRAHGARLAVVVFANRFEAEAARTGAPAGDLDPCLPARRILELGRRRAIPVLDLGPRFAARGPDFLGKLAIKHDGHWSREAHAAAAEETARFLAGETDLLGEAVARVGR